MAKRKQKPNKDEQLTTKQQRFVDAFDGNASQAAKIAGYAHSDVAGTRLLRNVKVATAIRDREKIRINPNIKSRTERQQFWSNLMDTAEKDADKLKASELLGKSEADFTDNIEHNMSNNMMTLVAKHLSKKVKNG